MFLRIVTVSMSKLWQWSTVRSLYETKRLHTLDFHMSSFHYPLIICLRLCNTMWWEQWWWTSKFCLLWMISMRIVICFITVYVSSTSLWDFLCWLGHRNSISITGCTTYLWVHAPSADSSSRFLDWHNSLQSAPRQSHYCLSAGTAETRRALQGYCGWMVRRPQWCRTRWNDCLESYLEPLRLGSNGRWLYDIYANDTRRYDYTLESLTDNILIGRILT